MTGNGLISVFCLSLLLAAQNAVAQTATNEISDSEALGGDIVGTAWGMTLALDGSGFYNDVLHIALDQMKHPKAYRPLPYKRAKMEFSTRKNGCLYPTRISHLLHGEEIESTEGYIETEPLVWVESHIFSKPGQPALVSFEKLNSMRIAYPNGSALPNVLRDYGAEFVPTTTETAKARMLIAGRVDYMSGSLPDNIFVFEALGLELPSYNPDLALVRVGVAVVCHDTPENRAFVDQFNKTRAIMFDEGFMQALFTSLNVDLRFLPKP